MYVYILFSSKLSYENYTMITKNIITNSVNIKAAIYEGNL